MILFEKATRDDIEKLTELRIAYLTEDNGRLDSAELALLKQNLSVVELKATEAGYPLYKLLGFEDEKSKYHSMRIKLCTEKTDLI